MSVRLASSVPLSVVIIARNEERRIGDCIDSVRSLTDDIVVVDSGSTDRTCEVAESHGARVVYHAWEGYSEQKNFGNGLAKHDWIFSLDADERVSVKLADSFRRELTAGPSCDAYRFRFKNFFVGKPVRFGAWNPESHVRLFDRRKFSWNSDDVHEGLQGAADCRVGNLEGVVLHFTIEERAQLAKKTELYASLFAQKVRQRKKSVSWAKIWLNPAWRFFRDYIVRLGLLDGAAGWKIAFEAARYTHLKYSRASDVSAGHRAPIRIGFATAAMALALLSYVSVSRRASKPSHTLQARVESSDSSARATRHQLAALDDNYEDAGVVWPLDDDGVA